MGKYQPYPYYGSEQTLLFGDIPSHWELSPLKYLVTFKGGGTPAKERPEFWNGEIPWVSPKDMKVDVIEDAADHITDAGLAASTTSVVEAGSVLLVVRSGILKHTIPVARSAKRVALNQDMKGLIPSSRILCDYLAFLAKGNQKQFLFAWRKEGATVESLDHELVANTYVPIPPINEQLTISSFLHHETAKIDHLIAKQERLIELLKEKRQAVISHAVTQGLNPDAPMKDSGVVWLGEVPAHWVICKFSHHINFQEGPGIMAEDFRDSGVPLLRIHNIQPGFITLEGCNYLDQEKAAKRWNHFRLEKGDLVISASATTGIVSEVGKEAIGAIPYTGLIRLKPGTACIRQQYIK